VSLGTLLPKSGPLQCPPPIWMHGRNRVFGKPAPDEARPGGGASTIMCTVWRCSRGPPSMEDGNGSSSNSTTGRHALGVHATLIYTEVWCNPHLSPGIWPAARRCIHPWPKIGTSVLATTQMVEALRARVRLGGRALDKPAWQTNHDTPLRLQICPHPCLSVLVLNRVLSGALDSQPLFPCSPCTGQRLLSTTCMHNIACHHIPPIPHSQELFCFVCWLSPLAFIAHFWKAILLCAPSPGFCGFVLEPCFSFLLVGSSGNSGFVHFGLFSYFFFANFWIFSIFEKFSLYVSQGFLMKYFCSIVPLVIFLSELCLHHWWHYMSEVKFSLQSVNSQSWRFTNNILGLPHAPSLSVCLFLWVCVECVYFLLYLSFYLCCARCVFWVRFCIHNHLFAFFLLRPSQYFRILNP